MKTQLTDSLFGWLTKCWPHAALRWLLYLGSEHQDKSAEECLSHSAAVSVITADVSDQEQTRQLLAQPRLQFRMWKGMEKMSSRKEDRPKWDDQVEMETSITEAENNLAACSVWHMTHPLCLQPNTLPMLWILHTMVWVNNISEFTVYHNNNNNNNTFYLWAPFMTLKATVQIKEIYHYLVEVALTGNGELSHLYRFFFVHLNPESVL